MGEMACFLRSLTTAVPLSTRDTVLAETPAAWATLPIVTGMPMLPWKAVRGLNDPAYRLMFSNQTVMPVIVAVISAPLAGAGKRL